MSGPRQFDVVRNRGRSAAVAPYFVIVQSNQYHRTVRRLAIPLVRRTAENSADPAINPVFVVEGVPLVLASLELGNYPITAFGPAVANVDDRSDAIVRALDEVLSRAWP